MKCRISLTLFEAYSKAAEEYSSSADKLSGFVGSHEQFEKAKLYTEQLQNNCHTSRVALEKHWLDHGCRTREAKKS
jgi:hypothetical protein